MKTKLYPIPSFYNPDNAASWAYAPNQAQLRTDGYAYRIANAVTAGISDRLKVELAIIDAQKDFCFPQGALYVAGRSGTGAIDDNRRLVEFIYTNLGTISGITTTMDTHFAYQIFFASFWQTSDGQPVQPHTQIKVEDVESGRLVPTMFALAALPLFKGNMVALQKQVLHYCKELKKAGKYELYVWPEHCILGSDGHPLVGVVHEARMFHSYVRGGQSLCEIKGGNPLSENYSVFSPEVLTLYNGEALAQKNHKLIQRLLTNDRIIFAGQAASHCVSSSIHDFLGGILAHDPSLVKKAYVMEDCMSAVTVPDGKGGFFLDYTADAEKALDEFRAAGMHVVKSTDPIETWPDFFNVSAA